MDAVKDYAIFMLDPQGKITSWNHGAERMKGYRAAEIIGKHFSCFYPEEEVRSGEPQRELERAVREGSFEEEGWRLRKNGWRFWANVVIAPLRDHRGALVGFAKITRDLHDMIGPVMSSVLMNLAIMERDSGVLSEKGRAALQEAKTLARRCSRILPAT